MKKRIKSRLLPFLLIMVVIANVITPGLIQPSVVYAAEEPAGPQQGTETPSSIVLGKGTIEINGHLFTNAEFQTFLKNAEIIRVPFEKPSALALGEYDDLVGNGAGTAGTLTILTGAVVGAFQKLTVMFNLADLAGSSYVAIGTIGGLTLPLAIKFHSDSLEITKPGEGTGEETESLEGQDVNLNDVDLDNLPEGWTRTDNNGFTHIKDANGEIRIRLDPPDSKTPYPHKHYYDVNRNPLDVNGNIVKPDSPDAHIPLGLV